MRASIIILLSLTATAFSLPSQPPPLLVTNPGNNEALDWSQNQGGPVVTPASVWSYAVCGDPTDALLITDLQVQPDPPKPGHNLTIFGTGISRQLVDEGAYADVVVKLGLIKLLSKRFDICEELRNANSTLQCPIEPGLHSVEEVAFLPREIPRAKYSIAIQAYTQDDEPLTCLTILMNFLLTDFL